MALSGSLADLSLANLLKKEAENSTGINEVLRYGFQIGDMNFVYDSEIHCEVVNSAQLYPVPNTPTWMLGLINLRGSLVPVFNLEEYFNSSPSTQKSKLVLILGKGEQAVAFQLHQYPKLLRNLIQLEDLPELPPKIKDYVATAYQEELLWFELDKEKFFSKLGEEVCY